MTPKKVQRKEKEEPRIGVYVCHCGLNIGAVVDCPQVAEYAATLPGVVLAKTNLYTCSDPGQEQIKKDISEQRLNRVVVASCTPRLHEPTFRAACQEAGLNPYLFEMANIREHCSWVHLHDKEAATAKAKDLVAMAVARAALLAPQLELDVPVMPQGPGHRGGVAGHPGGPGHGRRGLQGLPGGKGTEHRRPHGPDRQDLPHHGLFHLHPCAQNDAKSGAIPTSSCSPSTRSQRGRGLHRQFQGPGPQEGPLRDKGLHRMRRLHPGLPPAGPRRIQRGPVHSAGHLHSFRPGRPVHLPRSTWTCA